VRRRAWTPPTSSSLSARAERGQWLDARVREIAEKMPEYPALVEKILREAGGWRLAPCDDDVTESGGIVGAKKFRGQGSDAVPALRWALEAFPSRCPG